MKNTIRVSMFLFILLIIIYATKSYWEGWFIGVVSMLFTLSVLFIAFLIFMENRHPTRTLTWLVVLGSFPVLGFIFYMLFGRNVRKRRLFYKKALMDRQTAQKIEGDRNYTEEEMMSLGNGHRTMFQLATNIGRSPISFSTDTEVLTDGEETFNKIIEELGKATHHIHLEYYIVRHDDIGNKIKNILMEKAKSGVNVRFLYDAVGSWTLSKKYIRDLRESGVEVISFSPVRLPFFNNKIP